MELADLQKRVIFLEEAIRNHRDQKGDDRCWMDDEELYAVLPEGVGNSDRRLHCEGEMLENCKKFIASRHPEAHSYISPQRDIERLELACKVALERFRVDGWPLNDLNILAIRRLERALGLEINEPISE